MLMCTYEFAQGARAEGQVIRGKVEGAGRRRQLVVVNMRIYDLLKLHKNSDTNKTLQNKLSIYICI
jgi:hypothetical protein